jgi:hypothetical protein
LEYLRGFPGLAGLKLKFRPHMAWDIRVDERTPYYAFILISDLARNLFAGTNRVVPGGPVVDDFDVLALVAKSRRLAERYTSSRTLVSHSRTTVVAYR